MPWAGQGEAGALPCQVQSPEKDKSGACQAQQHGGVPHTVNWGKAEHMTGCKAQGRGLAAPTSGTWLVTMGPCVELSMPGLPPGDCQQYRAQACRCPG